MPRISQLFTLGYGSEDMEEAEGFSVQGAGKYKPSPLSQKKFEQGEVIGHWVWDEATKGLKLIIDPKFDQKTSD